MVAQSANSPAYRASLVGSEAVQVCPLHLAKAVNAGDFGQETSALKLLKLQHPWLVPWLLL
jgi:hypothetical protein